jgi:predicted metal-dependent phosphoesterase TrpH
MLVDLHAKSSISEGTDLSIDAVLDRAADEGLDGVAFCETLSTTYCDEVLERASNHEVDVFIGVEIPTDTGILLGFVPSIDNFYRAEFWRRYTDTMRPSPEAIIDLFEEHNGAVVAARPYDRSASFVMGDHIFELEGLHGVEVLNSRVSRTHNDFAVEAAAYMGASTVGGSDPTNSVDVIGSSATYFDGNVTSQSQLVEALHQEDFWAVELSE